MLITIRERRREGALRLGTRQIDVKRRPIKNRQLRQRGLMPNAPKTTHA